MNLLYTYLPSYLVPSIGDQQNIHTWEDYKAWLDRSNLMEHINLAELVLHNSSNNLYVVPWHITQSIKTAHGTVAKAVQYTKKDMPELYNFLLEHCSHLFTIENMKAKGLPMINTENMSSKDDYFDLSKGTIERFSAKYKKLAGVYAFFDKGVPVFIGSTHSISHRAYNHTAELYRKGNKVGFYRYAETVGGFSAFTWGPLITFPNYTKVYTNMYGKPTLNVEAILELFTFLQCRSAEQAYLHYYRPTLNGPSNVAFGFKWNPEAAPRLLHDPSPTTVYTESGEVLYFATTSEAAVYAGLAPVTIRARYNRNPPLWSYSTKLGQSVHFRRPHEPDLEEIKSNSILLEGIDLLSLPKYKTVILDASMNVIDAFDTPKEAAEYAGCTDLTGPALSKYINKPRALYSPVLGHNIYLASNLNARSRAKPVMAKAVLIKDVKGIEPDIILPTVASVAKHFGLKGSSGISHKIDSNQVYKKRYMLTFVETDTSRS